jgi:hypothetical protein
MVIDDKHADGVTGPRWADVSSPSPIGHFQIPSTKTPCRASSHVPGENADGTGSTANCLPR